ncbi:MAG: hypothetical protein ABW133_09725 [Polyangiaceae bacterium]
MTTLSSHRSSVTSALFCLGLSLATANCGAPAEPTVQAKDEEHAGLVRTISVRLEPGGGHTSRTSYQPAEQVARQIQRRTALAEQKKNGLLAAPSEEIIQDSECPDHALFLYSSDSQQGIRCCLVGSGEGGVEDLCIWFPEVHSYWPGSLPGGRNGTLGNSHNCYEDFWADDPVTGVTYCEGVYPHYAAPNYVFLY